MSQKVLVAVPVCHNDDWNECPLWVGDHTPENLQSRPTPQERIQAVRDTWWSDLTFDKKFFFGRGSRTLRDDEIILPVPDRFKKHCLKNQMMFQWALDNDYDWVFRCDDDAYVRPDRLTEASTELLGDQIGWGPWVGQGNNYITGGAGFWLSRKALSRIADAPITKTHEDDLWIGRDVLARPDIRRVHDPRYCPATASDGHGVDVTKLPSNWITVHSCSPKVMKEIHASLQPISDFVRP